MSDDFKTPVEQHLEQRIQRAEQIIAQQHQHLQQQQAQQTRQSFVNVVTQSEEALAQEAPDYYEAVENLKKVEVQRLVEQGMPENAAVARIQQSAIQIAHQAIVDGRDPAKALYHIAKRSGYTPAQAQAITNDAMQELEYGEPDPSNEDDIGALINDLNGNGDW